MWSPLLLLIALCSNSASLSNFEDFATVVRPKIYEEHIRRRRDASILKPIVQVGNLKLELDHEISLMTSAGLKAEWFDENGTLSVEEVRECDFKYGVVGGFDASSMVALAMCGQEIIGYIAIGNSGYFLEPLNGTSGEHLLYSNTRIKRHAFNEIKINRTSEQWIFNLTGDEIDIGDVPLTYEMEEELVEPKSSASPINWRRENVDDENIGYFYDTAWSVERPINHQKGGSMLPRRWLEVAIAVDHTLISFHGKDKVKQYVMALMNIVNAIYQDVSLDANMHLVITRLLLYEHKKQSVVRPGEAKKSLENVNTWNNRLHLGLAPGEQHHDVAVWLTRADIGGPSGYAPVAGACDPKRSCALNRDEGLTSAFIIAHEMAHILGLSHDGDKKHVNNCTEEADKGSVMAPLVAATFHQFLWSHCSRNEFRKMVKKWTCLSNTPISPGQVILNATLQNAFTMDEQCRMEFGDGFTHCRAFDIVEPCSHLWCGHEKSPLVCKTKKGSPLEGTQCGFNKWCWNGYCEVVDITTPARMPILLNPQDGGWSIWSPWGPCSRSCGTGVQFRSRRCNNPEPLHGGNACEGVSEKWKICNNQSCPEPFGDMRAQQCKRLPRLLGIEHTRQGNMTWLPYESDQLDKKCKLICISKSSKELFESEDNLIDGTPCSYENSDNICIQGICQVLGCDGQLFSNVKTDLCGVCGGNNSTCSNIKSNFHRKLKREVSRVAVYPRMASKINLEANVTMQDKEDPNVAFILKNRKKKRYTITIPNAGVGTEIIEGTKFYYEKIKSRHSIWAKGPVLAEMVVLVYAPMSEIEAGLNVSLRSQYVINKNAAVTSTRFKWIIGGWGPCSASCGGGRRQKTVACWNNYEQKLVRRKHCSLTTKPSLEFQQCNTFDCHFQWVTGVWEHCSATCGLKGMQHRELYCLPQDILGTMRQENRTKLTQPWKYMVNPNKCSGVMPITKRPCNREPCISYWSYGEWSQCSQSCGKGFSYRSSYCLPPEGENFYTCGEAPINRQKRVCRLNTRWTDTRCKRRHGKPCVGDESEFCSLTELAKYCKVGAFRKLCCKSCAEFRLIPISI